MKRFYKEWANEIKATLKEHYHCPEWKHEAGIAVDQILSELERGLVTEREARKYLGDIDQGKYPWVRGQIRVKGDIYAGLFGTLPTLYSDTETGYRATLNMDGTCLVKITAAAGNSMNRQDWGTVIFELEKRAYDVIDGTVEITC